MQSNHRSDDTQTSNECHWLNFHRRDLKFSYVVSNTMTIMNVNFKKIKISLDDSLYFHLLYIQAHIYQKCTDSEIW